MVAVAAEKKEVIGGWKRLRLDMQLVVAGCERDDIVNGSFFQKRMCLCLWICDMNERLSVDTGTLSVQR